MKGFWLGLFSLAMMTTAFASHIVGGEFELLHVVDYQYRINLILYFDLINGQPGAKDESATIRIFRKRDNAFVMDVFVPLSTEELVSYTQPECSHGEVRTNKLTYTTLVTLSPSVFYDAEGYYMMWGRCCRNYNITNIISEPPAPGSLNDPNATGQTFYLEFPPVVRDSEPFVNSSPHLFPPLNDYACPHHPYYAEFAGIDDDGDSLVYSMVTPLNTLNSGIYPIGPAPYPPVKWRPGFSLNDIMHGMPGLRISPDGLLTVTPTIQGLFVFAVKVNEYRDGLKIGETRRDFQLLVVDACPVAEPPHIVGKATGESGFTHEGTMSVTFSSTDEERCIQVQVSDPDASKPEDNFQENVHLKVIPIGFKDDVSDVLPPLPGVTLKNDDKAAFDICFPLCPYLGLQPYQLAIIAYDDACSLPLFDTLKVTVNVQPPPNVSAHFTTVKNVNTTLNEGDGQSWPIQAVDADGDDIAVGVIPVGFDPGAAGMTFTITQQEPGLVNGIFQWNAYCDIYDFTNQTDFELLILVDDLDTCGFNGPDTTRFLLHVNLPGNSDPVIDSDVTSAGSSGRKSASVTKHVLDNLNFHVTGTDADNDLLMLRGEGVGFDPADYGVSFPPSTANGLVSSLFSWDLTCDNVDPGIKSNFTFRFIVVDNANKCLFYKADTLDVKVKILPPENTQPMLTASSLNNILLDEGDHLEIIRGDTIHLTLLAFDGDLSPADHLHLELIDAEGNVKPEGFSFEDAEGTSPLGSVFRWSPDCTVFHDRIYTNDYTFRFRAYDDRCYNAMADTLTLAMKVKDVEREAVDFIPPNFVSANGDGVNDFFAMEGIEENLFPDPRAIGLPLDDCAGQFVGVLIFNRWGKVVFESARRDFRWYATGAAAGVYYYYLEYSDRNYRGTITVSN